MKFTSSKPSAPKTPKIATVIGKGTEVNGDIRFVGGLHVDGRIHGNINADEDENTALTVSELGKVEGDIRVPNVILNGEVEGNVYASQRVELAPKANVHGTVYYRFLEMAMGAVVNGQLIRSEEDRIRMLGYDGKGEKKPGASGPAAAASTHPAGDKSHEPLAGPPKGIKPVTPIKPEGS